ncbi:dynamin family protein [Streptosporangium sp. NPDC000563]|uniref:dynamin family protein n=1 Tax=Streptosporangium sp. NPDC000563 TaxID=3154366 RepID=UPI00332059B3
MPPSAPAGGDAAPGALFRPGAPVPPTNVPRTADPATSPSGTDTEAPASQEVPDPARETGVSASGTAVEEALSRSEGGAPGSDSGTGGAPPLRASRAEEKQERSDKDAEPDEVVPGTTSQERRNDSEDHAGSDGGTPGTTGLVEDDEAESGEGRRDATVATADTGIADETASDAEPSATADETPGENEDGGDDAAGDDVRDEAGTVDGGEEIKNEETQGEETQGETDELRSEDDERRGEDEEPRDEDEERRGEGEEAAPDGTRETALPEAVSEALSNALTAVRAGVTDLTFGLDLPGAEEARRVQGEILAQLDDYVIPRVHTSTAPALVVVAGSTGAGKSTLLNTLAKAKISATGVRRPTTGTPILACHPDDHEWFTESDLLGSLRRLSEPDPEAASGSLVLVSTEHLPSGVALLDTPDIDSVVEEHHEIAHRMLDAADLWIFVTTAARYADAPAWRLLRLAKERGARLAIVLSRVPPRSREVITKHFVRMLTEYGLGEVERFVINETRVTDGMLPDAEVSELRQWLTDLSVDDRRRAQAVRATLDGVLNSFRTRVPALAKHLEVQVAFRRDLRGDVDGAYARAMADVDKSTEDGSLLRGEVLARWQDFAGSGDLMRTLHLRRPSRFGGKANQQAPERISALKSALRAGLESVVVSAAQRASEEAASRWLNRPGAQEALAASPDLGRPSDDFARRTGRAVAAWQEHIIELIRTEGVTKRAVARVISFDDESLSLILTIGLLGYGSSDERNGAGALPQRLVHALLGAESLRNLGVKARSDLRARIGMLFDDEMARYAQALDGAGIPDESAATRLYQATYNLEVAR